MDQLRNRRAIIDRIDLQERVEAILDGDLNEADRASEVLNIYRETLKSGIAEIRSRFDDTRDGELTVRGHCFLIDQLIRVIHDIAVTWFYKAANPTAADQLCIVAYGGYGRGELAPRSDIDLLFLLPYKATPRVEQIIEHVLYTLWDLGLKVGHATRSIDDCIRQAHDDMVIRTGLLESRYIWGVQTLHAELRMRFFEEVVKGKGLFVEAKLHERDGRHERMGDCATFSNPTLRTAKAVCAICTLCFGSRSIFIAARASRSCGTKAFSRATNWRGSTKPSASYGPCGVIFIISRLGRKNV